MLFKMQSFTKNIKPRYIRNRKVACHQFCRYFEGDLGVCICVTCGHQGLPQPSSCSCKLRLPQPHFGNLNKTAMPHHCMLTLCRYAAQKEGSRFQTALSLGNVGSCASALKISSRSVSWGNL